MLAWVLSWAVSLVVFFVAVSAHYSFFLESKSKWSGPDFQVLIPYGVIAFAVLCSPLYLESYFVGGEYIFDQNGNYLYTIKPNRIGMMTQSEWNLHHKKEHKAKNKRELAYSYARSTVKIKDPADSAVCIEVIFTGRNEKEYRVRRGTFAVTEDLKPSFGEETSGYVVCSIVSKIIEDDVSLKTRLLTSARTFHAQQLPAENLLSVKADFFTNLIPVNDRLREYGVYITDVVVN